jgi:pimeloyl-ACP methyl ester carboxylesterase
MGLKLCVWAERSLKTAVLASALVALSGCTTVQRGMHLYSQAAPSAQTFAFQDGGRSVYYRFALGSAPNPATAVFVYGGSGCASWKAVMPDYVAGLAVDAHVFVLNKRHVADRSTGMFACGAAFDAANHPEQWRQDYTEFITAQLDALRPRPQKVLLLGVSEGAVPAVQVAARLPAITHLAIIGSGALTMRESLRLLHRKGQVAFDVDAASPRIAAAPESLEQRWYGHPHRWWSQMLDLDVMPDLLQLNIPIWVAMGEQDSSVPVESLHALQSRFQATGKTHLRTRCIREPITA